MEITNFHSIRSLRWDETWTEQLEEKHLMACRAEQQQKRKSNKCCFDLMGDSITVRLILNLNYLFGPDSFKKGTEEEWTPPGDQNYPLLVMKLFPHHSSQRSDEKREAYSLIYYPIKIVFKSNAFHRCIPNDGNMMGRGRERIAELLMTQNAD